MELHGRPAAKQCTEEQQSLAGLMTCLQHAQYELRNVRLADGRICQGFTAD